MLYGSLKQLCLCGRKAAKHLHIMSLGLGHWHIISVLSDDFLQEINWIHVFGGTGNEVIISTRNDDIYVLGANVNCCLGMAKSCQVGLQPKRLDKLCGKNIISISAGNGPHVLALTRNGDIYSWGHNGYGQLGHGDTSIHTRMPVIIGSTLTGVPIGQVACGAYHSVALSKDGKVYTWGFNNCGQLGQGDATSRYMPSIVHGLLDDERCKQVSCCYSSSYSLTQEGKVYSWGQNGCGQLGIGTTNQSFNPCPVFSLFNTPIEKIASGYSHVIALTSSGDLFTWGNNNHGQLGNGTKSNQCSPSSVLGKGIEKFVEIATSTSCHISTAESVKGKVLMWGECCHQSVVTPLETDLRSVDDVFAKYASPNCSWRPFQAKPDGDRHDTVSQCIENRFNDPDTSDLQFFVNGEAIFVHKAILRMRSSYFYAMFKKGTWVEGQMDSVEITDHPLRTFCSFLKYLYTDKIDSPLEEIPNLLKLADLYCEFNLKEQCSRLLCRQIDEENVLTLYLLSLQYKLKELEELSFSYILKHSSAVVQSNAFIELDGSFAKQLVMSMAENGAFKC